MLKNLIGGLAGALALNLIHQFAKKVHADAPEVDKIGEEALSKAVTAAGYTPPVGQALFNATLAADIAANTLYYSLIGCGSRKNLLLRGAMLGAAAGIGALTLTKPLGLDDTPVNKNCKAQTMTVGWYLLGGVVAALTIDALKRSK
jgi:hypothetical protein